MLHLPTLVLIAAGVCLILFGARYIRKGLGRIFGPRLGRWMQRLTDGRIRSAFFGLGASVLAPSSTTISALAVQNIRAGHLSIRSAIAVVLGADVGLTLMVLLIAYRIDALWPVLVAIGVILFLFTRRSMQKGTGQALIGLAIVFLGVGTIRSAANDLAPDSDLLRIIVIAGKHPFWTAILSTGLAFMLQSSTATIALAIGLAVRPANELPIEFALATVAGANVGIGITTLMLGWSHRDARRVATANLLAKVCVAMVFLAGISFVARGVEWIPGEMSSRIAYAHIGFNLVLFVVFLPLIHPLASLVQRWISDEVGREGTDHGPRYITSSPAEGWSMSLGQSQREIMHVAEIARQMLADFWDSFVQSDAGMAREVASRDDQIDHLDVQIKRFLTRLSTEEGDDEDAREQMTQLGYLNELENIGDIIETNLCDLAIKRAKQHVTFSSEGWSELQEFHNKVSENMLIAETAFVTRDASLAEQLIRHKRSINDMERTLREKHFDRLRTGTAVSHESSALHLDLLTHLKRINSCVTHVAYSLLMDRNGSGV